MKRYTEAELQEFERAPRRIAELIEYIRREIGTVEIPKFRPFPNAAERAIIRYRRKQNYAQIDPAVLERLAKIERELQKWRTGKPSKFTDLGNARNW